jgi:pyruvate,orthophosphate dikinase
VLCDVILRGRVTVPESIGSNADTPADAQVARALGAEGIGLCRTEHMFFEEDRIPWMRRMILADDAADRAESLSKLLPMQQKDFEGIFAALSGLPVTVRLLDPPLHEFLPHGDKALASLAAQMGVPAKKVAARGRRRSPKPTRCSALKSLLR